MRPLKGGEPRSWARKSLKARSGEKATSALSKLRFRVHGVPLAARPTVRGGVNSGTVGRAASGTQPERLGLTKHYGNDERADSRRTDWKAFQLARAPSPNRQSAER
jgi:hypothetical protein